MLISGWLLGSIYIHFEENTLNCKMHQNVKYFKSFLEFPFFDLFFQANNSPLHIQKHTYTQTQDEAGIVT